MTKNDDVAKGQTFTVRLSSSKNCAIFESTIFRVYEDQVYMDSPDQLRIGPPLEPIRRRSPIEDCFITDTFGESTKGKVLDIGPNGIGFESMMHFNPDETVQVCIETKAGTMTAQAKVVYCHVVRDGLIYRTGVSITSQDRLSHGHWRTMLSAA